MNNCRFCGSQVQRDDAICANCGYNPKTDTIDPYLRQHMELAKKSKRAKQSGRKQLLGPGVKKFVFIGLALTVFSVFYKYNFNIVLVGAEFKYIFTMLRTGKVFQLWKSHEENEDKNKVIELMDVRSFKVPKNIAKYKNLVVEGIFFDPQAGNFVVINGEVVPEGDNFNNVTVKKVNKNSVELIAGGETKTLETNQSIPFPRK